MKVLNITLLFGVIVGVYAAPIDRRSLTERQVSELIPAPRLSARSEVAVINPITASSSSFSTFPIDVASSSSFSRVPVANSSGKAPCSNSLSTPSSSSVSASSGLTPWELALNLRRSKRKADQKK